MANRTKTSKAAYFGRRCEVKEIFAAGAHGEREIRRRWIDDADGCNGGYPAGTITSTTVTGNPLKGTFQTLIEHHIVEEF
jgi:hypothetical protein